MPKDRDDELHHPVEWRTRIDIIYNCLVIYAMIFLCIYVII
jgi:hypothetical protein